jgi:hypothetical protein
VSVSVRVKAVPRARRSWHSSCLVAVTEPSSCSSGRAREAQAGPEVQLAPRGPATWYWASPSRVQHGPLARRIGVGIAQMGFPCFVWRQHAAYGPFHAWECRLPPQRALWDSTRWRTTRFYNPGCLRACVVSYSGALRQLTAGAFHWWSRQGHEGARKAKPNTTSNKATGSARGGATGPVPQNGRH